MKYIQKQKQRDGSYRYRAVIHLNGKKIRFHTWIDIQQAIQDRDDFITANKLPIRFSKRWQPHTTEIIWSKRGPRLRKPLSHVRRKLNRCRWCWKESLSPKGWNNESSMHIKCEKEQEAVNRYYARKDSRLSRMRKMQAEISERMPVLSLQTQSKVM